MITLHDRTAHTIIGCKHVDEQTRWAALLRREGEDRLPFMQTEAGHSLSDSLDSYRATPGSGGGHRPVIMNYRHIVRHHQPDRLETALILYAARISGAYLSGGFTVKFTTLPYGSGLVFEVLFERFQPTFVLAADADRRPCEFVS